MPHKDPEKRRAYNREYSRRFYQEHLEPERIRKREYARNNKEKVNAIARKARAKDPERYYAYQKRWRDEHPKEVALIRRKQMLKKHGLTLEDYDRMLAEQDGLCKICGKPETAVKCGKVQLLTVEHCHASGKVRGLTCNRCNRGLGLFGDDPALLRAAAAYLES